MKPHYKNKKSDKQLLVYGKHPVVEKLESNPQSILQLYLKDTLDPQVLGDMKARAKKGKVNISVVSESQLNDMTEGAVHQGMVASVAPVKFVELHEWLESIVGIERPCVVLLDELEDQHNVGAIIRTAVAAGVHGIILPKHRQAPIGGIAYKTSVGLVEKIPLIQVGNVNDTIRTLKENRFWVVGLDMNGKETLWSQDLDMATCIVIGGEGEGMRQKTGELCDFLVRIPMEPAAESLNASVSAALMMYEWKRRQQ